MARPLSRARGAARCVCRTHTQCIASDLFATVPGFEPDALSYTCGICLDVLRLPVVLSCTHRFCNACLAQAADKYHQCPICKKEMDLNPANYPIDSVLARHVRSHFGAAAAESAFASEGDLPSVLEQKLRSALAAADGGADGDEGGAGPLADSTDTEVEEARDGPCAARAEPGRGGAGPSAGGLSAALEQPGAPGAPLLTSVPPPGPPGAPPLAHAEASERFGSPTVRLGSPTVSSLLWMDALSSLEATEARAAEEGVGYAAQLTPPPPPHTPSGAQRWPPASAEAEAEASHAAGAYLVAAAAARADGGGGSAALGPSGGAEDVLSFTLDGLLSGPSAAPPSAAATHTPTLGVGRTLKPGGQRKMACDKCHRAKAACEGYPCRRCERLNVPCVFPVCARALSVRQAAHPSPARARRRRAAPRAAHHSHSQRLTGPPRAARRRRLPPLGTQDKPRASKRARAEEAPAVEALSAGSAAGPIVLAAPCIAQPIGAHSRLAATPSEQPQPQPQRWERQQQPAVPAPSQAQLQPQLPPPPPAAQGHAQRAHPDSQPGSRHPQLLHSAALAPLPLHGGSMAALPASAAPPPAVGQGVRHALGSQPDVLDALSLALPQGEWRSKR